MVITSEQVKTLREKTGAGMMDCKKALTEAGGDMEKASELLRKRGIAIAEKKVGRVAADGTIGHHFSSDAKVGVLLEINCETDFVTKTDDFKNYVKVATEIVKDKNPKDTDEFLGLKHGGTSLREFETGLIAKIGEKLGLRRFVRWATGSDHGKLTQYIHAGNKIGVMVEFADPSGKLTDTKAREVAMHIAAMNPRYLRKEDIPADVIEKEKEIVKSQMGDTKKPPEILEKIVTGKIQKFYNEVCLEDQLFVCDPEGSLTVAKALAKIDPGIKITRFVRLQVGEGIEKRDS